MWWLILCVSLPGPQQGPQTFGQTLFWAFLDEINIWNNRLQKADCPPFCGWAPSNQLKAWTEQKSWPSLKEEGIPSCLVTTWTVAVQVPVFMGILQARILEWVAMPSSRGASWPRDRIHISSGSCTAGEFFTTEPPGKPKKLHKVSLFNTFI